jgi:hypothetical protein
VWHLWEVLPLGSVTTLESLIALGSMLPLGKCANSMYKSDCFVPDLSHNPSLLLRHG